MGKYSIVIPEDCSVPVIYDAVAAAAGKDPQICRYDCRYVWVAENVFQVFFDYMGSNNRKDSIGAQLLMVGSKADENLKAGEV